MKKEISKKYIFPLYLLSFVSVFGATPPPIRSAPPPPGFPLDGSFLLVSIVIGVAFGVYKLKISTSKN